MLYFANSFTDALTKLSSQEQKQAKLTAFDLQMDPRGNGSQLHRIEKAPGFWSIRVSGDIRIILFKNAETTLLAYVDHHDAAYRWAERRRVAPHERTGAMQFVVVPEVDDVIPMETAVAIIGGSTYRWPIPGGLSEPLGNDEIGAHVQGRIPAQPHPFKPLSDNQLLDVGVPREWLDRVRQAYQTDVEDLFDNLPGEAAEALLDFLTGGRLEDHIAPRLQPGADPFAHPDAQRRFRVVENLEELKAALDQPFEKWAVFLHPAQRALVERTWSGPARISGSAGTGKTIVALHRAAFLAKSRGTGVLLTTFSKPLAAALAKKRDILAQSEPELRDLVTVAALDQAAFEIYTRQFGQPTMATASQVRAAIKAAQDASLGNSFTPQFLFEEWGELVDAWNVTEASAYASIPRLGRRTRLGPVQRESAWQVFTFVQKRLAERNVTTWSQLYARLAEWLSEKNGRLLFSHVVVDEAQDLSVAQSRFLAAIGKLDKEAIFFTGDQGQRIFHLPFSWISLGIDIRGRGHSLKVNYRTSHQIRSTADRLLPSVIVDVDGVEESRRGTVSVFDGPDPQIILAADEGEEIELVANYLRTCLAEGMEPRDLAILVRSQRQFSRARSAANAAGLDYEGANGITITAMHDAKGLEFRGVAVMACDDDVIPDGGRIAAIGDMAEMEAVFESERHLLYVACTRPRDRLIVTAIEPGSEFLVDLCHRTTLTE